MVASMRFARSFPRTRGGDPFFCVLSFYDYVLFPAHAGVILRIYNPDNKEITFPRTRGGDPGIVVDDNAIPFFSPHTRG